jgi:hypothetical protein
MAKNKMAIGIDIKNCRDCKYAEYKEKYETLAAKHDFILDEAKKMKSELDEFALEHGELIIEKDELFTYAENLQKEVERISKTTQNARLAAVRAFAKKLCEGRVSNDPVVIAVKTELKMAGVEL